jgi:hypothetical protein
MINKLYISTVDYHWNDSALTLVNHRNLDRLIEQADAVDCHTSVEDLTCKNISLACEHAGEIILVDVDQDIAVTNTNCFSYGRLFDELLRHPGKVKNFSWTKSFDHVEQDRTGDGPLLWTVGCSITYGIGVDPQERWGTRLANQLNLSEVSLSRPGSSISWAADQILRSDIRAGDTVVWGLTNISRVEISENWTTKSASIGHYITLEKDYQYWNLDYFESQTQVLWAFKSILQVINFCKKIQAQLYIVNLLDIAWLGVMLSGFKNYIDLTQGLPIDNTTLHIQFVDLGSDGNHPGPEQHRQYAEKIFNFIKESNHG